MQGLIMSTLSFAIKSGLALFVIAAFLSCNEKPITELITATKPVQTTKTAKPGAAIKLVSNSLIAISANELVHTDILLEAMESQGELIVEFSSSQGLILDNISPSHTIKLNGAAPIKIPVAIRAISNGRYYLNMHISLNNTDAISVRNIALIVQVGPLLDSAVKFQKTAGENLIVLPAQETISHK